MNRRAFLKVSTTAGFVCACPSGFLAATKDSPSNGDILADATKRIEQHRMGEALIAVRDTQGRPVPGAKVAITQLKHDFLFGCNLFMFDRCGTSELETAYRNRFAALFNYATLGFYWASYERQRGKPNYDYTDQVLEWTSRQGIVCKGHPLVWDHPASSPLWLPDDHQEIAVLSNSRTREIVRRFQGRIDMWDVVNEPTHLPEKHNKTRMADWGAALGPVPYVAEPLRIARESNRTATLLVNDYRLQPAYYKILDSLREEGSLLFDAVGLQSHMHDGPWSPERTWEICQRYAKLGLPLHFSETTILSGPRKGPREDWGQSTPEGEANQAEKTAAFYTVLFSHPAVQGITWWDFSDHGAWQRAPAGWLRRDMSPKPVYERLRELIKQRWWTRKETTVDQRGEVRLRCFYGRYHLTADLPGANSISREVTVARDCDNRFELS